MAIGSIIVTALGTIGSAIGGLFNFKGRQADAIIKAMEVLSEANMSNEAREAAIAQIISAEANSSSWLTRMWRPIVMVSFVGLVYGYWFGWTPPNLTGPMPEIVRELFDLIKIALMGYIPARTIDKIVQSINVSKVLQTFIDKKLT